MNTLYHYCSNEAFCAIIESQSVRLSSLSLSNDSKEGKLVADIINHLAIKDGLREHEISRLQYSVETIERIIEGLGFCLSEKGDLLSQWRGYASDATGVSIGFSSEYFIELSKTLEEEKAKGFSLEKIVYEEDEQIALVSPTYNEVKELIDKGAYDLPRVKGLLDTRTEEEIEKEYEELKSKSLEAGMTIFTLFTELFRLKSAAFIEEQEWRLISHFFKVGKDECMFHALGNRIIPYRTSNLRKLETNPIREVVLGPKNITPNFVVESFLEKFGFSEVKVLRSAATYR